MALPGATSELIRATIHEILQVWRKYSGCIVKVLAVRVSDTKSKHTSVIARLRNARNAQKLAIRNGQAFRNHSLIERALLGSTAEHVIRESQTPVLSVPVYAFNAAQQTRTSGIIEDHNLRGPRGSSGSAASPRVSIEPR
jgi:hypothetical protein